MNECQTVGVVAVATHSRLGDAPAVQLHPGAECAHLALEKRLLHLWDQLRRADHHPVDGDQLIDVCGGIKKAEGLARMTMPHICSEGGNRFPKMATLNVG